MWSDEKITFHEILPISNTFIGTTQANCGSRETDLELTMN